MKDFKIALCQKLKLVHNIRKTHLIMCDIFTCACKIRETLKIELYNFIYWSLQSSIQCPQTGKGHKTSDKNSTAVKFSNSTSEIWLSMRLFNREIHVATILALVSANCETQLNSKPVRKMAITSLPRGKLFTAVSCSCLAVNNFAILAKNLQVQ